MYRVIFHLNEEDKVAAACRNIENLLIDIDESKEEIEVELLVHAGAVRSFTEEKASVDDNIKELLNKGVKIAVCSNSLKGLEIKESELLKNIVVVPSGVGELTRKQNEGWAYIKP